MNAFFKQSLVTIKIGHYELEVPESHILVKLGKIQPYRDICVGVAAKYIAEKYPDMLIIDIGANIGDTAAMIASYCNSKLLLVEASDYFFEILQKNVSQFPNQINLKKVLVSDGTEVSGALYHWGGTAYFKEENKNVRIKTERLCDLANENTCLVKLDTDGYDFKIILDGISWFSQTKSSILFENQIRSPQELEDANRVYQELTAIGYKYFIVWDDPGFHLLSTSSLDILFNLNRYLFKVWERKNYRTICNYDVLCLHENDKDLYESLNQWCNSY